MGGKKEKFVLGIILFSAIASLYFIFASPLAPTSLTFTGNVTPIYDEGNFSVNWSSGGGDAEANYSIYVLLGADAFLKADNDSIRGYSFDNWTEANYTFVIEATNGTGTSVNSTNISLTISMYVDRTAPSITLPFYTNATAIKNITSLTLNISVIDASSGETDSLCLIDINGTNQSVAVTNNWCNLTYGNLTGLTDGNHTIKVYVNDTVGIFGVNDSFAVQTDTTAPVALYGCSPSLLGVEEEVICTCQGTDATSGINSSLTTSNLTTTHGVAGVYSYNCSVTDNAGNTASGTESYEVVGRQTSSNSATSSTFFWTEGTQVISDKEFEEGANVQIQSKRRAKINIDGGTHYVGVVSLSSAQATINITSEPIQVILDVGENTKVDATGNGFYDIHLLLNSIANNKANITLQKIHEEIPFEEGNNETMNELGSEEEQKENETYASLILIISIIFVLIIIGFIIKKRKYFFKK